VSLESKCEGVADDENGEYKMTWFV